MLAHFQPLCARTAFNLRCGVSCGLSKGGAHYQPGGAPPTPCCRRGRQGGWSEALCVLRGAPGQANIVAEVRISFSHGFRASCRCLGPHKGDPARRPGASLPPTEAGGMLVLRRAPSKVVFRLRFHRLETKISLQAVGARSAPTQHTAADGGLKSTCKSKGRYSRVRPTTRASPTGPMWSLAALKASRDLGLCLFSPNKPILTTGVPKNINFRVAACLIAYVSLLGDQRGGA